MNSQQVEQKTEHRSLVTQRLLEGLSLYREELGDVGTYLELLLRTEGAAGKQDQEYLRHYH